MNNYDAAVNQKYAAQIAEVCNTETDLNVSAEQVEGYAVYLSSLLERTDCKQTVDQVLCACMADWGCWNAMVEYFKRRGNEHERNTFD